MARRLTQKQRILEAFRAAPLHRLSVRYIKRDMLISEANARVSNLREDGYAIEKVDTDEFGFAVLELREPKRKIITYEPVMENGRQVAVRLVESWVQQ